MRWAHQWQMRTGEARTEQSIIDVAELMWDPPVIRSNAPPDAS